MRILHSCILPVYKACHFFSLLIPAYNKIIRIGINVCKNIFLR